MPLHRSRSASSARGPIEVSSPLSTPALVIGAPLSIRGRWSLHGRSTVCVAHRGSRSWSAASPRWWPAASPPLVAIVLRLRRVVLVLRRIRMSPPPSVLVSSCALVALILGIGVVVVVVVAVAVVLILVVLLRRVWSLGRRRLRVALRRPGSRRSPWWRRLVVVLIVSHGRWSRGRG